MSALDTGGVLIHGNFSDLLPEPPTGQDRFDSEYRALVDYRFDWRDKVGQTVCTCVQVEEWYQPYYGWTWYHTDGCALMKRIKERPGLMNLPCFQHLPVIAASE